MGVFVGVEVLVGVTVGVDVGVWDTAKQLSTEVISPAPPVTTKTTLGSVAKSIYQPSLTGTVHEPPYTYKNSPNAGLEEGLTSKLSVNGEVQAVALLTTLYSNNTVVHILCHYNFFSQFCRDNLRTSHGYVYSHTQGNGVQRVHRNTIEVGNCQ